jgi:predicted exporter
MAVFAALGLSNTYIIIRFLYPSLLRKTQAHAIPAPLIKLEKRLSKAVLACFKKYFYLKTALIVLVSGIGICMINPGDGLKNLYTPEKSLLEKEALFAQISGTASAPVMIVVQGKNEQEVLEKEEGIRLSLDGFDYRAPSQAIPSLRKQARNYALTEALYKNELGTYLATIGAPKGIKEKMEAHLASQKDSPLMPTEMPKALKPLLTQDSSVLVIENAADKAKLARIADEHGALYSDRFQEISQTLKALRARASIFLAMTCALIFCVLAYFYKGAKKAALMALPTFLSVIIALGVFGFAGVQISLFHILALFLVVYLGADYVIFRAEEKDREGHTGVAVALSCLTSIATFGALGLTSFAVTKALGLTLCLGLTFSYLLSPLAALMSPKD